MASVRLFLNTSFLTSVKIESEFLGSIVRSLEQEARGFAVLS